MYTRKKSIQSNRSVKKIPTKICDTNEQDTLEVVSPRSRLLQVGAQNQAIPRAVWDVDDFFDDLSLKSPKKDIRKGVKSRKHTAESRERPAPLHKEIAETNTHSNLQREFEEHRLRSSKEKIVESPKVCSIHESFSKLSNMECAYEELSDELPETIEYKWHSESSEDNYCGEDVGERNKEISGSEEGDQEQNASTLSRVHSPNHHFGSPSASSLPKPKSVDIYARNPQLREQQRLIQEKDISHR